MRCSASITEHVMTVIRVVCLLKMRLHYIYIYLYLGTHQLKFKHFVVFIEVCSINTTKCLNPSLFYLKARAITSGETPQKSLILPHVHTLKKMRVAPLNLIFS